MQPLTWTEAMSVGDAAMDAQHRHIIELLNLFERQLTAQLAFGAILSMICYADSHFSDEEALLARLEYPELELQRREHRAFLTQAHAFADERLDDATLHTRIVDFLTRWLERHILHEDMKYKPYAEKRAATPT